LPADKEVALFRIAQEALVNCVKHSRATSVSIHLGCESGRVKLAIADNGIGMRDGEPGEPGEPADRVGLGLLSMRERAAAVGAEFFVKSEPGLGTRVVVELRT
jgi:signal transduction histidine kinase